MEEIIELVSANSCEDESEILATVTNRLYFFGEVEEENSLKFIKELHEMTDILIYYYEKYTDKFIEKFGNNLIIYLSTQGGSIHEGFAIYQAIKECSRYFNIVIHCYGKIMSAGLLILAAGNERVSSQNTTFMVHEAWLSATGHTSHLLNETSDLKRISHKYLETLKKEFGNDGIRNLIKPNINTYFSTTKAKRLNILTKIIR